MPGKVKVKVIAGRNLPVMDRSSDTTDAYVEVKLGNTTFKTDVCRKSLNPQWNSEWYRFEVDDSELQDEPLQVRLMDHDTYSANDFIGKVYLDLNPLLLPAAPHMSDSTSTSSGGGSVMSGWIPVYDTMHGIRGEVNLMVKLELFSDFNKFRQSSCGVQFFCSQVIPQGYHAPVIHGFVEELVVYDDPEYQWIDKIRPPRASNEARQTLLFKLSGEIQRKIGLKALDMGGNAVIGYSQNFDLEGDSGIVARGIGTAVTLMRSPDGQQHADVGNKESSVGAASNKNPAPRMGCQFPGVGQIGAHRSRRVTPGPRVTQRGRFSYSLRSEDQGYRAALRMHANRMLCRSMLSQKGRGEDELACVLEGSFSSSSSSLSSSPEWSHTAPLPVINVPCTGLDTSSPIHKSASATALVGCVSHASNLICRGGEEETEDAPEPVPRLLSAHHHPVVPSAAQPIYRRSSDSDLSITPKAGSLTGSDRSCGHRAPPILSRPALNQESVDMLEYPFLTMSRYPPGFLQHIGGTVSARSVKLLERITNLEEPETRDAWWTELRMEVRSHARALGCNVVVGYSEATSICDDVCVLSAAGTAALINLTQDDVFASENRETDRSDRNESDLPCSLCHIPYAENSVPFRVSMHRCGLCRKGNVPDVLFTTIDLVNAAPTTGHGSFIHAYVARPKKDCKGEMNAKEISDGLPFLEYDLHRLLMSKLKVKGMNTIQGLKVQISIGEKLLIGLATGTAALLSALPAPHAPKLSAGNSWKDSKKLTEMQKLLTDSFNKNQDFYQLNTFQEQQEDSSLRTEDHESEHDLPELDLALGNKDACILEVDDAQDADIVSSLADPRPPDGFHVVCTEGVPGLQDVEVVRNLQMFTHVWRSKIPYGQPLSLYNVHINRLLQSIVFKLRNTNPATLSGLQLKVLLEQDEVQLSVVGMALGVCERRKIESDFVFSLEEPAPPVKPRKHIPPKSRHGVDITPLSYVPGGTIEKYLGNLNFFFIRESSCIREGGGLSGFVHNFIMEVLAIVRAHITALGGNAMVAYFMSECFLYNYPHKNQGQCLINVGGDAVYVSYFPTVEQ